MRRGKTEGDLRRRFFGLATNEKQCIIIKTNTFKKRGPRIVRAIRINSIEGMKESQCPVMALALFKD